MLVVCPICSTPFNRCKSSMKWNRVSYCSKACAWRGNRSTLTDSEKAIRNRETRKAWRENNPEKLKAITKRTVAKNKEAIKDSHRRHRIKRSKDISDAYVKSMICNGTSLATKDIPQSLVRAKRAEIKLKRLIKEMY